MTRPQLHFTSGSPQETLGDLVDSYRFAAEKLGYTTSYVQSCISTDQINIMFFFWNKPLEYIDGIYPNGVIVNFEPMVPGTHSWLDNYRSVLKRFYVWEYSQTNFQRNQELGFRAADYVPLLHEPMAAPTVATGAALNEVDLDFDVVFFGTATQRRVDIIAELVRRGLKVAYNNLRQWSHQEREEMILRSKVALNMHNWENSRVVEVHRIRLLLRHRKAIVCELYPDSEIPPELRKAVVGAPYDGLVDAVEALVADANRRSKLQEKSTYFLQLNLQTSVLGPALEHFLQWRSQQLLDVNVAAVECVTVCLYVPRVDAALQRTIECMAQSTHKNVDLIILLDSSCHRSGPELYVEKCGVSGARIVQLNEGCDRCTAWNLGISLSQGSHLIFSTSGDENAPNRLQRQASFLAAQVDIDIVGSWAQSEIEGGGPTQVPELDCEIKADLFGPTPIKIGSCMVRKSFVVDNGLRFRPDFVEHSELEFVCNCVVAGARFAAIPEALYKPHGPDTPLRALPNKLPVPYAVQARQMLVFALFPDLTSLQSQNIASIYSEFWPPEINFAESVLLTLASACAHHSSALGTDPEMLTRVLRREACRMLHIFFNANLFDQLWIDQQFSNIEIAAFLAPISAQLPLRPSNGVTPSV